MARTANKVAAAPVVEAAKEEEGGAVQAVDTVVSAAPIISNEGPSLLDINRIVREAQAREAAEFDSIGDTVKKVLADTLAKARPQ